MQALKKLLVKLLKDTAYKIEAGTCEISETEAMDIISMLSHEPLSKAEACSYLNLGRSRFDELVKERKLPKGRKRKGFKELYFYKDELNTAMIKIKNEKNKL